MKSYFIYYLVDSFEYKTQGFPFQMKQLVKALLHDETIWTRSAHFSAKRANLTARLRLVADDWDLHRSRKSPVASWKGIPGNLCICRLLFTLYNNHHVLLYSNTILLTFVTRILLAAVFGIFQRWAKLLLFFSFQKLFLFFNLYICNSWKIWIQLLQLTRS